MLPFVVLIRSDPFLGVDGFTVDGTSEPSESTSLLRTAITTELSSLTLALSSLATGRSFTGATDTKTVA